MIIVLMGVSGSGKTTVGRILAEQLRWTFLEGDEFHTAANIEKMRSGIALQDEDRRPWLAALQARLEIACERGETVVLACSALKESYRRYLLIDPQVRLIYLKADRQLIRRRLQQRPGHFMSPALLESQFATLEEPQDAIWLDASLNPLDIITLIRHRLQI